MDNLTAEQLLDLTGTYTPRDLRNAYRRAVHRYHPDANITATDQQTLNAHMADINSAYQYLRALFASSGLSEITAIYYPDPAPSITPPPADVITDFIPPDDRPSADNFTATSQPAPASQNETTAQNEKPQQPTTAPAPETTPDTARTTDDPPAWLRVFFHIPFGLIAFVLSIVFCLNVWAGADFSASSDGSQLLSYLTCAGASALVLLAFAGWITRTISTALQMLVIGIYDLITHRASLD